MFERSHYVRNLPHYQTANKVYLVTFVTLNRRVLPEAARDVVLEEIRRIHDEEAFIHAATVMPDHVHLVLQPLWDARGLVYHLSHILRLIKGRSSRRMNVSGHVWLDESHDHQIRSDESLTQKIDYVLQNPVRAGLSTTPDEYPWIFRWWIEGQKNSGTG